MVIRANKKMRTDRTYRTALVSRTVSKNTQRRILQVTLSFVNKKIFPVLLHVSISKVFDWVK